MRFNHKISWYLIFCILAILTMSLTCVTANENIELNSTNDFIEEDNSNSINFDFSNVIYEEEISSINNNKLKNIGSIDENNGRGNDLFDYIEVNDYISMINALNSAEIGDTIVLTNHIYFQTENEFVIDHKTLTIDGNGYTIYGTDNRIFNITSNADTVTFKNLALVGSNVPNKYGGAIYNSGTNVKFEYVNFTNNKALLGGAIYTENIIIVENCNFKGNEANNGGALYLMGSSNTRIMNSLFENNIADENGGAIYVMDGVRLLMENSNFTNNNANVFGGAIYSSNYLNVLSNIIAENNNATLGSFIFLSNKEDTGRSTTLSRSTISGSNEILIYNGNQNTLELSRNTMNSNINEKIFNNGTLTGQTNLKFLNGETLNCYIGDIVNLTAILTDDMGNIIVGQNVTFNFGGHVIETDNFIDGIYTIEFKTNERGTFAITGSYDGGNPTITQGILIVYEVILEVNKSTNVNSANVGELVNYTIVIKNNGNLAEDSINITEYIPLGLQYVSSNGIGWTNDDLNKTWFYNRLLQPGEITTLTFTFRVNGAFPGSANNTINIISNHTNQNETSNEINLTSVVLDIKKVASTPLTKVGEQIKFTITVTNHGNSSATNVKVTDYFPIEFLRYVGYENSTGLWNRNGNTFEWDLVGPFYSNGDSVDLILIFEVLEFGIFNNTAGVISKETPNSIYATSQNVTSSSAYLNVVKQPSANVIRQGEYVNYTITIVNEGNDVVSDIFLTDYFLEGLDFIKTFNNESWNQIGSNVWKYNGNLSIGESATLILNFYGRESGEYVNIINVDYNNFDVSFNFTSEEVIVHNVTLESQKVENNAIAQVDDYITYTITVTNTGTSNATNIIVYDDFDISKLSFVEILENSLWSSYGPNAWKLNSPLAPNQSVNLTLRFKVIGIGIVNNSAIITSREFENISVQSGNTVLTNVSLVITKEPSAEVIKIGEKLNYTITIKNTGTTEATNLIVSDEFFPYYLRYFNFVNVDDVWDYDNTNKVWKLKADLLPGKTVSLVLIFDTIITGNVTNWINVTTDQINGSVESNSVRIHNVSLAINKTVDKSQVQVGDEISYTIIVTNDGETDSYEIIIEDTYNIDNLIRYSDYIEKDKWDFAQIGNRVLFRYKGILNSTKSDTLTLIYTVIEAGNVNNTAFVDSSEVSTINATSNNTLLTDVKLEIKKEANTDVIKWGETLSYNIAIRNYGTTNATNLTLIDIIPDYLDYIDFNVNPDWEYDNITKVWYYKKILEPGQTINIVLNFKVIESGDFVNTIIVNTNQTSANKTSDLVHSHNVTLEFEKITTTEIATIGQQISYTIKITNTGTTNATNVYIYDMFPNELEFYASSNQSGRWYQYQIGNFNRWNLNGILEAGQSEYLTLIFTVTGTGTTDGSPGIINNTAIINSTQSFNNIAISNNTTIIDIHLIINKIGPELVKVGEIINYTITIVNTGSTNATNLTLRDLLPDTYMEFYEFYDPDNNWIDNGNDWTLKFDLAKNNQVTVYISFIAKETGKNILNTLNITYNENPDGQQFNSNPLEIHNVTLLINKTAPPTANIGGYIYYTITIKNNGTTNATNIVLREYFNTTHLVYEGYWRSDRNWLYSYDENGYLIFSLPGGEVIRANETVILTLRFYVRSAGIPVNETEPIFNNVTVIAREDNASTITNGTNLTRVNVTTYKSNHIYRYPFIKVGEVITFHVVINNTGETPATGLKITEFYDYDFLEFINSSGSGWFTNDNITWFYSGSLAPNATTILYLQFIVKKAGIFNNTVNITSDQEPEGKIRYDIVEAHNITLNISKSVNASNANVGDVIRYNITISNIGTSPLTTEMIDKYDILLQLTDYINNINGLKLIDLLFDSDLWNVYNENTTFVFRGLLNNGSSVSLIFDFKVISASDRVVNNTANLEINRDINPNLNVTSDNTTLHHVVLSIQKEAHIAPPYFNKLGENVTYTIRIENSGTTEATNVTLIDMFPAEYLEYLNFTSNKGNWYYNSTSKTWVLNETLNGNDYVEIVLIFKTLKTGQGIQNNASVISDQTPKPVNTSAAINVHDVILNITKSVNVTQANYGEYISFTINVTNIGTSDSQIVYLNDLVNGFENLEFIRAIGGKWQQVTIGNNNEWFLINGLKALESESITFIFRVNDTGKAINSVNVSFWENNTNITIFSDEITLTNVSLIVSKIPHVNLIKWNETLNYTINIKNNGTTEATNVSFTDLFPEEILKYVDFDALPGIWHYNLTTKTWYLLNPLNSQEEVSITLIFKVIGTGSIINKVNVTSNQQNKSVVAQEIEAHNVTLSITKIESVNKAQVGDIIYYTITIYNTGTTGTTGFRIYDYVENFSNLEYKGIKETNLWTYRGNGEFVYWDSLGANSNTTLTLIFEVNGTGTVKNIVNAESIQEDISTTSGETILTNVNLTIIKKPSLDVIRVGLPINYTITIKNVGSTNATNLILTEIIPTEYLKYVKAYYDPSIWYTDDNITWTLLTDLGFNDEVSLIFEFIVEGIGLFNNTINITTDQINYTKNSSEVRSHNVTLDVNKTVNTNIANTGDIIYYTITIKNTGNSTSYDVTIYDNVDIYGLKFIGYSNENEWTYNETTKTWVLKRGLTINETATLILTFKVVGNATVSNTVKVNSSETNDKQVTSEETVLTDVNLTVTKIANTDIIKVGQLINYTINITNVGNTTAHNITFTDEYGSLIYRGYTNLTSGWVTYDNKTWFYNGELDSNESILLVLTFEATQIGLFENIINVTSNETPKGVIAKSTVRGHNVTLNVTKFVNESSVQVDDYLYYEVIVSNKGSSDASGVVVIDDVRGIYGLEFVGYANGTYSWTTTDYKHWYLVGNLTASQDAILKLIFKVIDTGVTNNTVFVNSTEYNQINNISDNTNLTNVSLKVTKTPNVYLVKVGESITFTIVIENVGTTDAYNVTFSELYLSYYLKFLSSISNDGRIWSSDNKTWVLNGILASGDSVSINLTFTVLNVGIFNNSLNTSSFQTPDGQVNESDDVRSHNVTLNVTKFVNESSVQVDDYLYYEVIVSNKGSSDASGVVVIDDVRGIYGLEFVGYANGTYSWTTTDYKHWYLVGNLTASQDAILKLIFKVIDTGVTNNTVFVNSTEYNQINNISDNTNLTNVSLKVTKTPNVYLVKVGESITFTIVIENVGTTDAYNVTFSELYLSYYLKFLSSISNDGRIWSSDNKTWVLNGILASGDSVSINLTFTVLNVGIFNNSLNTSSFQTPDGQVNESDDVRSHNVTLNVTKFVNESSVQVDDYLYYEVIVSNKGSSDASGVVVIDDVRGIYGLEFVGYANGTYSWTTTDYKHWYLVGNLTASQDAILKLIFKVIDTGVTNNTVFVNSTEYNQINNISDNTNLTNVTLTITKEVNTTRANIGDYVKYTIYINNTGTTTATNVFIIDNFPLGMELDYFVETDLWNRTGQNTWKLYESLENGTNITLTLIFKVKGNYTGNVSNYVLVNSTQTSNDTSSIFTNLTNVTLVVTKGVNVSRANVGDIVEYKINVTNVGSTVATGVVLEDLVPAGMVVDSFVETDLWDRNGNVWTLKGSIANSSSVSLTILFKVKGNFTGMVNNTVIVNTTETKNNKNTSDDINLTNVTLTITKDVNVSTANVGDIVEYKINVTNVGSTVATGVVLEDLVPAGMVVDSFVETDLWDRNGNVWTLKGSIANSSSVSLTILFKVKGNFTGMVNNTVIVNTTETKNNKNTSDNINLTNVTLTITKDVNVSTANVGDIVEYKINVTNVGSTVATGVVLEDLVPAGMVVDSFVETDLWDRNGNVWTLKGSIANSSSVSLTILFKVKGNFTGMVNNTVIVNTTETKNNKNTSDDINLTNVTLYVTKDVNASLANIGDLIEYKIIVFNVGSTNASNVILTDMFPEGLNFIDFVEKDLWSFYSLTNTWILNDDLKGYSNVTLTLIFNVTGKHIGYIFNNVTVDNDQYKTINNISDETLLTNVTLDITKNANVSRANYNELIKYEINVYNSGSTIANNVSLTEIIPYGMIFVSFVETDLWDRDGNVWTLKDSLLNGSRVTLTLIFKVTGEYIGNVNNTIIVNTNESKNNIAVSENVNLTDVKLNISKTSNVTLAYKGEFLYYYINITNYGSSDAHDLKIVDYFPKGLTYFNYESNDNWTYDYDGIWYLNNPLAANSSVSLLVIFEVNGEYIGNVSNKINVTTFETPKPKEVICDNILLLNILISKEIDNPTPNLGNTILWINTVSNLGDFDVFLDYVVDYYPIGLKLVNATEDYEVFEYNSTHYKIVWKDVSIKANSDIILNVYTYVDTLEDSTSYVVLGNHVPYSTVNTDEAKIESITNITVVKSVSNSNPYNGELISYYITILSNGPVFGDLVISTDILPEGLIYVNSYTDYGYVSYNEKTREIKWHIFYVPNIGSYRLTIDVVVNTTKSTIDNFVEVTTGYYDRYMGNPKDNVSISIKNSSDISVNIVVDKSSVEVGSNVIYTIIVKNNGLFDAENVYVLNYLDGGLKYISYLAEKGVYDIENNKWFIGNLKAGESCILYMFVNTMVTGNLIHMVEVYSDYSYEFKSSDNVSIIVYKNPTPGPKPGPMPDPSSKTHDGIEDLNNMNAMEKTGNSILILLILMISTLIIPFRRKK
ncbi:hypothetical protein [Methanobrevibacter sp. DSM 116169]|uniref:hypothetical protein n=1 Tax=Methanobrevibacter sp. DSM 116169 TaxID=3242727 RepID=UPI0038FC895B